jgi:phospho-N-acetylmuramoyl-pentapeptide-transferase
MLYHLLAPLAEFHIIFNMFRFQSFRAVGAAVTVLLVAFLVGSAMSLRLQSRKAGVARLANASTRQMKSTRIRSGGFFVVITTLVPTLLWAELTNPYTVAAIVVLVWMCAVGSRGDRSKALHSNRQLPDRWSSIGLQSLAGIFLGLFAVFFPFSDVPATWTQIPFVETSHIDFVWPAYILFVTVFVAGSSNAVQRMDALDELPMGLAAIAASTLGALAYLMGRVDTSDYLQVFYLPGAGELAIFCIALAGACLGLLWYSSQPGGMEMGRSGALAVGGALGTIAVVLKSELLLFIICGAFLLEPMSSVAQTIYFRYTAWRTGTGRWILRATPLHRHLEQIGWPPEKILLYYWTLGILLSVVAFGAVMSTGSGMREETFYRAIPQD